MNKELEKDVVIIGSGISGLAAAYYLQKSAKPLRIALLEANAYCGGTIQTEVKEGCILDSGPDSFVTNKPWGIELAKELGLADELIAPDPLCSKIYLARRNRLYALPKGMALGVPLQFSAFFFNRALPWTVKLRMGCDLFSKPRFTPHDLSLAQFMKRHFGQKAIDLLIEPILGGIYAGRAEQLSLDATFPMFKNLESRYGSLIRGFRQHRKNAPQTPLFYSFKQGMGTLIKALQEKISEKTILFNQRATSISRNEEKNGFHVHTESGLKMKTARIIVALPASQAAQLFTNQAPFKSILDSFQSSSTATVFLAYPRKAIAHALDGYGFIVPRQESSRLLACTWISSKFPNRSPKDIFLMRFFLGGVGHEEFTHLDKDGLFKIVQEEARHFLDIHEKPLFSRVFYWHKASPQYLVGHLDQVQQMEQAVTQWPGLSFIGNSYRGIGIPDCIRQAKECAGLIAASASLN